MGEFGGDTFIYTDEGREGDMERTQGDKEIRDHTADGRELHLFEINYETWSVTYLWQFECVDWSTEDLPDTNGNLRNAIRFKLEPVDSEIEIDDLGQVDLETLYERMVGNSAPEYQEAKPQRQRGRPTAVESGQ